VKCPECKEKLVDYLYNELSPKGKQEMDQHLATCEQCKRELSHFQLVRTSFQQLKKEEPSALVHQRILAHAKDSSLQKNRSWLTQLLFKPSTATVMAVLIAVGIFYYTQPFITPGTDTGKVMVKAVGVAEEKRDQIVKDELTVAALGRRERAKMAPSAFMSSDRKVRKGKALQARTPPNITPGPSEMLLAESRPSVTLSGGMYPDKSDAISRMAKALEEHSETKLSSMQSKDALNVFEMGNFYFSQSDFEKAIANYSIALMMNPRGGYADTIRYQLAISYKKMNDCKSAVKVLDDIQKQYPQYQAIDKVIIMAGDCYMDLRAYEKAETNYSNFIHKYPDRKSQVADRLENAKMFRRANLNY